ncbi:MAG: MlaD family protein [Candidatus Obscuribacterales bacterium]|nr:MlaD family protein [Candidatus Obscuribacterales bacterium]
MVEEQKSQPEPHLPPGSDGSGEELDQKQLQQLQSDTEKLQRELQQQKQQLQQQQRMREASDTAIGMFGLIALICLFGAWLWFKDEPIGHRAQQFTVVFSDVDGLTDSAAVRVNGVRVGAVDGVELTSENMVHVRVKVTSGLTVPQGAEFEIVNDGLVGAKVLQVVMPKMSTAQSKLVALDKSVVVRGRDPRHPEKKLFALADRLDQFNFQRIDSDLHNSATRLAAAADEAAAVARSSRPAIANLSTAANRTASFLRSAQPTLASANATLVRSQLALDRATIAANGVNELTAEWRGASRQIAKLLNDPKVSADLKEITKDGREIAESIQVAVCALNKSLEDEALRKDILCGLDQIKQSTANIHSSVAAVEKVVGDGTLRADVSAVLGDVRKTLQSVNESIKGADFSGDVKCTMAKVRTMADRIDQVGAQLHQVLDSRAPGLQLMVGRPGHLKDSRPLVEQECRSCDNNSARGAPEKDCKKVGPVKISPSGTAVKFD